MVGTKKMILQSTKTIKYSQMVMEINKKRRNVINQSPFKISLLQDITFTIPDLELLHKCCRHLWLQESFFLFLSLQSFSLQLFIQCESQLTHSNSDVYDRDAFKELDERLGALAYCGQQEEVVHDCFLFGGECKCNKIKKRWMNAAGHKRQKWFVPSDVVGGIRVRLQRYLVK